MNGFKRSFVGSEDRGDGDRVRNISVLRCRSHCLCDVHFKSCLEGVGTMSSKAVGRLFFNVGGVSCFRLDHPIVGCLKPSG